MMNNRALVVIDIQNDITNHYRDDAIACVPEMLAYYERQGCELINNKRPVS